MANPVCLSPLKFYDDIAKQSHRKSYAHGHISPLFTKIHRLPPFQFIIPSYLSHINNAGGNVDNPQYTSTSGVNACLEELYINGFQTGYHFSYFTWNGSVATIVIKDSNDNVILFVNGRSATIGEVFKYTQNGVTLYAIFTSSTHNISPQNSSILEDALSLNKNPKISDYIDTDSLSAYLYDAKTDSLISSNVISSLVNNGFMLNAYKGYKVASYNSNKAIFTNLSEGLYYIKIASDNDIWAYYSEVFCFTEVTHDLIEIEYWNESGDFSIKNGIVAFTNNFHFKLLLKSELGKPEYSFEEESTKRLGYVFIESQVSKKIYKFNTVVPEFICDAMRLIRLCDNKLIRSLDEEYDAMSFEMEAEWQTQGDLASVNCEFETDSVIVNLGGFVPDKLGGDYNNDYNDDFDKE